MRSRYGDLLREARLSRGLSQLGLAGTAGVSTKHLSFLETGRSVPSREMVEQLCDALELPLRDRNPMLLAAGYAPAHPARAFDGPELATIRDVLSRWIEAQHPYPALVINRTSDVLLVNRAMSLLLTVAFDGPAPTELGSNLVTMLLHPKGLRRVIRNFDVVASAIVRRSRLTARTAMELATIEALVSAYLGGVRLDATPADDVPVIPVEWALRGRRIDTITAIATLGTALDATVEELHIETILPADAASERALREMVQAFEGA